MQTHKDKFEQTLLIIYERLERDLSQRNFLGQFFLMTTDILTHDIRFDALNKVFL